MGKGTLLAAFQTNLSEDPAQPHPSLLLYLGSRPVHLLRQPTGLDS